MFNLSVIALDKKLFEGEVEFVSVPGSDGELTILKNHLPLITYLVKGDVKIKIEKEEKKIPISGGVLEVKPNETIILLNP